VGSGRCQEFLDFSQGLEPKGNPVDCLRRLAVRAVSSLFVKCSPMELVQLVERFAAR
jgi:hypothetical protein